VVEVTLNSKAVTSSFPAANFKVWKTYAR